MYLIPVRNIRENGCFFKSFWVNAEVISAIKDQFQVIFPTPCYRDQIGCGLCLRNKAFPISQCR